jgi:hypothetical protein
MSLVKDITYNDDKNGLDMLCYVMRGLLFNR